MNRKNNSLNRNHGRYIDEERYKEMVAVCAYYKSKKREFEDGYELQDWLEAEEEINTQLAYWSQ